MIHAARSDTTPGIPSIRRCEGLRALLLGALALLVPACGGGSGDGGDPVLTHELVVTSAPAGAVDAGDAFSVTVEIHQVGGELDPNQNATISAMLGSGAGSLAAASGGLSAASTNGAVTFDLVHDTTATIRVDFAATGITGTSANITISEVNGRPTKLGFKTSPQDTDQGATWPTFTVEFRDASGDPAEAGQLPAGDDTITITKTAGGGNLSGMLSVQADAAMPVTEANFDGLSIDAGGIIEIQANTALTMSAGVPLTAVRDTLEVTPSAPAAPSVSSVGDGWVKLAWGAVQGTVNLYWGFSSGFSSSLNAGQSYSAADTTLASPFLHTTVPNSPDGVTPSVWYVLTRSVDGIESGPSAETAATPVAIAGTDTYFTGGCTDGSGFQWHLDASGCTDPDVLADINVAGVWSTYRGEGVRVAVVDDGVHFLPNNVDPLSSIHEDLFPNMIRFGSFDYVDGDRIPDADCIAQNNCGSLILHGTAVAGLIAAQDANDVGTRGVAPRANLVAFTLLSADATASNEADAMTRDSEVGPSNNSWGPQDGLGLFTPSLSLWRDAIETGIQGARGGKGTVYLWAAGNGRNADCDTDPVTTAVSDSDPGTCQTDNSNYDGYANFHGVFAVCALGSDGTQAGYSEHGANLLLCAPSSSSELPGQLTTDVVGSGGYNSGSGGNLANDDYTNNFGGTSGATPLVAGVVALMLEANPALSWRDVRLILAETADRTTIKAADADHGFVFNNGESSAGAAYEVSHKYGFGLVDAAAAVQRAEEWDTMGITVGGGLPTIVSGSASPAVTIPDADASNNPTGSVISTITLAGSVDNSMGVLDGVEFVEVTLTLTADTGLFWGDYRVVLESPDGTQSILAEPHTCSGDADCNEAGGSWRFGTVRHMGENADGNWMLTITDELTEDQGILTSWSIRVFGE